MIKDVKIVGVLNVTPNSFSDGGNFFSPERALKRAEEIIKQGADIIDIGAESTAPGNAEISAGEEWKRLEYILSTLLQKNYPISLDSQKVTIWEKFLQLGGIMINDVSGLQKDEKEKIYLLKKFSKSQIIVMFSRDISKKDPSDLKNTIVSDIFNFFSKKITLLNREGINKSRIILDPGMGGFLSRDPEISFEVIRNLKKFLPLGCKLYIGTSRKSFLSKISGNKPPEKRVLSSILSSLVSIKNGATYVRVHDVEEMRETIEISKTLSFL